MKISKTKLHQIIKEELRSVLGEGASMFPPSPDQGSTRILGRAAQKREREASKAPTANVRKRGSASTEPIQHPSVLPGEKAAVDFRAGPTHRSAADVSQAFADRELGINDEFEADDAVRQTYNLPNGWQDDPDIEPKKMRFYMDQYEKLLSKLRSAEFDR